jgi:hypothetical protein
VGSSKDKPIRGRAEEPGAGPKHVRPVPPCCERFWEERPVAIRVRDDPGPQGQLVGQVLPKPFDGVANLPRRHERKPDAAPRSPAAPEPRVDPEIRVAHFRAGMTAEPGGHQHFSYVPRVGHPVDGEPADRQVRYQPKGAGNRVLDRQQKPGGQDIRGDALLPMPEGESPRGRVSGSARY